MYANKNVLIVGLGRFGGGVGVVKYLAKNGAKLRITDLEKESQLKDSLAKIKEIPADYVLGQHRLKDIGWADVIVFNPAVPPNSAFFQAAVKSGKKLETEINILFKISRAKIIGITGTNGKATVSGLIAAMLAEEYSSKNVFLAGNMGISILDKAEKLTPKQFIVVELSSFQLNRLSWIKKSPYLSVLTNITPDHVEWHLSLEKYSQDKLNIFRYQKAGDKAVVNLYDPVSRQLLKPWPFSSQVSFLADEGKNKIIDAKTILVNNRVFKLPAHNLIGRHNLINILQASTAADLLKVKEEKIAQALAKYQPPANALEYVSTIKGITFINDSEASNQDAAIKGLEALPKKKIILIAGGYDKGIDLNQFVQTIKKRVKFTVLIGQTAKKLSRLFEKTNYSAFTTAKNLQEAVAIAYRQAKTGDYLLLSPAASSYDMFKNLEERGDLFKKYVFQLEK